MPRMHESRSFQALSPKVLAIKNQLVAKCFFFLAVKLFSYIWRSQVFTSSQSIRWEVTGREIKIENQNGGDQCVFFLVIPSVSLWKCRHTNFHSMHTSRSTFAAYRPIVDQMTSDCRPSVDRVLIKKSIEDIDRLSIADAVCTHYPRFCW